MRKKQYQSDISREQFEQIRHLLESAHKKVAKRYELHTFAVIPSAGSLCSHFTQHALDYCSMTKHIFNATQS